jgi:hypothetical protein
MFLAQIESALRRAGPDLNCYLGPAERHALWIRTRIMAERRCEHDLVHLGGRRCKRGVERADRASRALVVFDASGPQFGLSAHLRVMQKYPQY